MKPQASSAEVQVRHLHSLEEFQVCLELQKCVWGGADIDVVPLPLFVVAAETGGQVLGAFAGAPEPENMIGFTLAMAGVREGIAFLHSHMTAVLEAYRDRGIGRQLKLYQRQDALGRGIGLVEWTFDPLELKNAHFNLRRLGAIARRFLPNCYGITSSPLHGRLPTDRLVAEWWLRSARVEKLLGASGDAGRAGPGTPERKAAVRIRVPAEIGGLSRNNAEQARRVQSEIGQQFEHWFSRGYAATGIEFTADAGEYLLEPWSAR